MQTIEAGAPKTVDFNSFAHMMKGLERALQSNSGSTAQISGYLNVDIKRVQSFSCEAYCSSCTKNEKKTCKMYIVGNHFYCDVCDSQFDTNTKDDKAKYTWGVRVVAEDTGGISEELVFYQEALQSLLGQSARDYYFSDAKAQGRAGKHLLGQYIAQVRAKSQAQKVIFTCTKLHKVAKVG
eukprot:TRINITY_DN11477_c0_g1_i1.p1 TRINITY_DN11477_c0_g1~~TRINITY_DN11477_c0_g1_i1.p1  ORF type:complete len:181 (+),score=25.70 TRINITY_DN11477_c0_g1_i1:90-632(+)